MDLLYNFQPGSAEGRPSFFELLLETQMMDSLKPALEYILSTLAQRYESLQSALNWSDELFLVFQLILERHYLKYHGSFFVTYQKPLFLDGSFSENFYSLRRVVVTKDQKVGPVLTRDKKLISIFFLVPRLQLSQTSIPGYVSVY